MVKWPRLLFTLSNIVNIYEKSLARDDVNFTNIIEFSVGLNLG